jgi:phage terminase large subunit
MKLSIKQTQALDYLEDKVTNELIYGGGAGGGKSILGCYWIVKQCLKYPGTRWLVGRSKGKTLKETTLNSLFEVTKMQGMKADVDFIYNQQAGVIKFANGSEILLKDLFLYPADPDFDELGSLEITGAFIDECNQIVEKAWNIVKSRIRYKLDEYGIVPKILGTCNPSRGYVYYNFYKPFRDGVLSHKKAFIESLVDDNPFISQYYKENLQTLDLASKQRLLFGNWDYQDTQKSLFNYSALIDVFSNAVDDKPTNYLIIDVGGDKETGDATKFSYWEGLVEMWRKTFYGLRSEDIIQKAREFAKEYKIPYSRITVDSIGIGESIGNSSLLDGIVPFKSSYAPIKTDESIVSLPNVHYTKTAPLVSDYVNLRSQCTFVLAEHINTHKIASRTQGEDKEKVIEELSLYQDITKNDEKRKVTSKDDIKVLLGRSPDDSDCFIMRMYFEVRNKIAPDQSEQQAQVKSKMQDQFAKRKRDFANSSTR